MLLEEENGLTVELPSLNGRRNDLFISLILEKVLVWTRLKIAETEMHQPSQCPFCMKKREGFAKVEFLCRKKTILDNVLLQEKLEDYMYTKDSLTLIGEIHKSLPKLSEDPSNIWQELNKRVKCPRKPSTDWIL